MKSVLIYGWITALALTLVGCEQHPPQTSKIQSSTLQTEASTKQLPQSSPSAVAVYFQHALKHRKWREALRCVTKESKAMILGTAYIMASMMALDNTAQRESFDVICRSHRILSEPSEKVLSKPNLDKNLIVDEMAEACSAFVTWIAENDNGAAFDFPAFKIGPIESGTKHTTAEAVFGPNNQKFRLRFERIRGKWFIALLPFPGLREVGRKPARQKSSKM